jgi:transposase
MAAIGSSVDVPSVTKMKDGVAMKSRRGFYLDEKDRSLLLSWLGSPALKATMALRARVVLASADGQSVRALARKLGVSIDTVCLWRRRFRAEGLDGLRSRALPGTKKRIDRQQERAIMLAAERRDAMGAPPSVASVARAVGVSRATVRRLWERRAAAVQDVAAEPGVAAPPSAIAPGTLVGVYLQPALRLFARVPPSPPHALSAPAPGEAPAAPPGGAWSRAAGREPLGTTAGAILTAVEAFTPDGARALAALGGADAGARAFLRQLARSLPDGLEIVGDRGSWRDAEALRDLAAAGRRLRVVQARTRGQCLALAARFLAQVPADQEPALAGLLGHLTDHFAAWRSGAPPFVWTHAHGVQKLPRPDDDAADDGGLTAAAEDELASVAAADR